MKNTFWTNHNNEIYLQTKRNFVIGVICFAVAIVCAVGSFLHGQKVDVLNLLYYDVADIRVYAFVIPTIAAYALFGIPFIQFAWVKRLFTKILYLITHNAELLEFASESSADTFIITETDEHGNTVFTDTEKSKFAVIVETLLGLILFIVIGALLYTVGVALSLFILIWQLVWLLANRN